MPAARFAARLRFSRLHHDPPLGLCKRFAAGLSYNSWERWLEVPQGYYLGLCSALRVLAPGCVESGSGLEEAGGFGSSLCQVCGGSVLG